MGQDAALVLVEIPVALGKGPAHEVDQLLELSDELEGELRAPPAALKGKKAGAGAEQRGLGDDGLVAVDGGAEAVGELGEEGIRVPFPEDGRGVGHSRGDGGQLALQSQTVEAAALFDEAAQALLVGDEALGTGGVDELTTQQLHDAHDCRVLDARPALVEGLVEQVEDLCLNRESK